MKKEVKKYPKHACQFCGCERKYIETIIDDEFIWDEKYQGYVPNGFTDAFEHTGVVSCAECRQPWTGL